MSYEDDYDRGFDDGEGCAAARYEEIITAGAGKGLGELHVTLNADAILESVTISVEEQIRSRAESLLSNVISQKVDDVYRSRDTESLAEVVNRLVAERVTSILTKPDVVTEGWGSDRKSYSIEEYIEAQVRKRIFKLEHDGELLIIEKNRYGSDTVSKSFKSIVEEMFAAKYATMLNTIETMVKREADNMRDEINSKAKAMFDEQTRSVMSDAVLNILASNELYQNMTKQIATIGSKENS